MSTMKLNLIFVLTFVAFCCTYGQDSSSRNAVGKTGDITKEIPGSEKDVRTVSSNQIKREAPPVTTNEIINEQVSGDLNDNKKNSSSGKSGKEGPK